MKIQASFPFESYKFDATHDTHMVLSLQAPVKEGTERPRVCVVPVVDVSGSMSGKPLEYAKESVLRLVDHLRDGDYTGLVVFGSHSRVLVKPQVLTASVRAALRAEVAKLMASGGTNFAGGMLDALKLVEDLDLPTAIQRRVILFTDGEPTQGVVVAPADIVKVLKANAAGTSVSAFGYGPGVKQDFLLSLAEAGGGSYAHIDQPEKALAAFGRELGGLITTYATDVVVTVQPTNGHSLPAVLSQVPHETEALGGQVTLRIASLLHEERVALVFQAGLAQQSQAFPRPVNAYEVRVVAKVLDPSGKVISFEQSVVAKVRFARETGPEITDVARDVALARLAQVQKSAEEAAQAGNFAAAVATFGVLRSADHLPGMQEVSEKLAAQYGNLESYNNSTRYRAATTAGLRRGMNAVSGDAEALQALSLTGLVLSNSAQVALADSFSAPTPAPIPEVKPLGAWEVDPSVGLRVAPTNK